MDEEQHILSDWERHEIFTKSKEKGLPKFVPDVIYNLRRFLVKELIDSIIAKLDSNDQNNDPKLSNHELLNEAKEYIGLQKILAEKLNRVV